MQIVEVKGMELSDLLRSLRAELRETSEAIHTFRFAIDDGEIKFKVNEGPWSLGYGRSSS